MDLEKIAEASHQAWFVAMAKQGWIFGPRLNPDFKTHPWLKPYGSLADPVKEIVRAQVRGTLAALESQGVSAGAVSAAVAQRPQAPAATPTAAPVRPTTPPQPAAQPVAQAQPAPVATPAAQPVKPAAEPARAAGGADIEVLERKVDSSGRMRIGSGLVKKAELLPGGSTQVGIVSKGSTIEVMPNADAPGDAFFAAVNPDGFMLPKAILAGTGAAEFTIHIQLGRLILRPKA